MADQNQQGQQGPKPEKAAKQDKTLAILSLVFAIVMPLVGLVLALIARNKYPKGVEGHELVKPALIVSIILTVLPLFLILMGGALYFI